MNATRLERSRVNIPHIGKGSREIRDEGPSK